MNINQFDIWLANLNPAQGTEPGKIRPVVVVQSNMLNKTHQSMVICPISTNLRPEVEILRVHLEKEQLDKPSDILVDQIRAIDNKRFIKRLGKLTAGQIEKLKENIKIVLDL